MHATRNARPRTATTTRHEASSTAVRNYMQHLASRPQCTSILDMGLCNSKNNSIALHYLRIAKTGSTSISLALRAAQDASVECRASLVVHSAHAVTASHVESAMEPRPPPATFTVVREPCERFASLFGFLKPNPPVESTSWAWSVAASSSAHEWARLLLRNATLRAETIKRDANDSSWRLPRMMPSRSGRTPAYVNYLAAAQSAYLHSRVGRAHIVCLSPRLAADVQSLLDVWAPACTVQHIPWIHPEKAKAWRGNDSSTLEHQPEEEYHAGPPLTPTLCTDARALYPEDAALWERHCAAGRWTPEGAVIANVTT